MKEGTEAQDTLHVYDTWYKYTYGLNTIEEVKARAVPDSKAFIELGSGNMAYRKTKWHEYHPSKEMAIAAAQKRLNKDLLAAYLRVHKIEEDLKKLQEM